MVTVKALYYIYIYLSTGIFIFDLQSILKVKVMHSFTVNISKMVTDAYVGIRNQIAYLTWMSQADLHWLQWHPQWNCSGF